MPHSPCRAVFSADIKGVAANVAARHYYFCKNVIARYRTVGALSDSLQRGALPTSDNVVLRLQPVESSARCFHAAAGALRNLADTHETTTGAGRALDLSGAMGVH